MFNPLHLRLFLLIIFFPSSALPNSHVGIFCSHSSSFLFRLFLLFRLLLLLLIFLLLFSPPHLSPPPSHHPPPPLLLLLLLLILFLYPNSPPFFPLRALF
uniref:Uncharacterized protein n=1 Tax=Cacopsylla melanoneura TaxID=428564 RepID=A0A8D8LZT9_9HEMI